MSGTTGSAGGKAEDRVPLDGVSYQIIGGNESRWGREERNAVQGKESTIQVTPRDLCHPFTPIATRYNDVRLVLQDNSSCCRRRLLISDQPDPSLLASTHSFASERSTLVQHEIHT